MFCCTLLYVHSSIAIILMGKRELVALHNLSSWCLVMVERLFLALLRGCLQFVIVVFPDHTHLLFSVMFSRPKEDKVNQILQTGCSSEEICANSSPFLKTVVKLNLMMHLLKCKPEISTSYNK